MILSADCFFISSFFLCALSAVIAFSLFGFFRRKAQGHVFIQRGKVSTEAFNRSDLAGLAFFLIMYFCFFLNSESSSNSGGERSHSLLALILGLVIQGAFLICIVFLIFYKRGQDITDVFGLKRFKFREIIFVSFSGIFSAFGFLFLLHLCSYSELLERFFGEYAKPQEIIRFYLSMDPPARVALASLAIVLAPLSEEIVFRGYIYAGAKKFSNREFATFFSSLLFALVHFNINALLPLFVLSIILCFIYERMGTLWAPMFTHALFNAFMIANIEFNPFTES